MTRLFEGDEYSTAADVPRPLLVRCLGWTRIPFYWYVSRPLRQGRREALAGTFTDERFIAHAEDVVRAVERCGGRVEVSGMEHLSEVDGPLVLIGNHMSFLETFVLPAMVLPRKPLSFVVKESLVEHSAIAPILATQEPISLTRTNPRQDLRTLLTEGKQRLADGRSVCVFPQSTRRTDFSEKTFNSIGSKLAQRAGKPIIPLALRTDFLGNGTLVKDLGPVCLEHTVHFAFGEPIDSTDAKQAQSQVVAFVRANLSSWGVSCQ